MYALTLFVVLSLVVGGVFWRRFGTVFNPPSLCAFSLGGASSIAMFFDTLIRNGSVIHAGFVGPTTATASIFVVGLVAFVIPWLNARRKPHSFTICADRNINRTLLQLDVVVITAVIVTWCLLGQIPINAMLTGRASINDHLANLQNLTPGVMMINLAGLTTLSLYVASRSVYPRLSFSSKSIFIVSILIALIASGWQGNRQSFLIFLFFVLTRNFFKWTETYGQMPSKEKIWRLRAFTAFAMLAFVGGFTAINYIRLASEGRFSGPMELFLYYSWPVYNMVSITSRIGLGGTGDFMFLLTELLPARLGGKGVWVEITPLLFEPTSPGGYFSYWYLSFGIVGVAAGSLLLGAASRYFFEVSAKSEYHLRMYVLILWSCATISVYSHFLSIAYFWIPLVSLFIVGLCSRLSLVPPAMQRQEQF